MSREHEYPRAERRRTRRRITCPDPPAYLAVVPGELLTPDTDAGLLSGYRARQLVRFLANRKLPRPTLLQFEAERRRRGLR